MIFANYNPQSWIKMCLSLFEKLGNFFLQKFEKWQNIIFEPMYCWDSPMSRLLEPLLLKNRRYRGWFVPKKYQWLQNYVCVTYLVVSFLSYLPVKRIWRNKAVCPIRFIYHQNNCIYCKCLQGCRISK